MMTKLMGLSSERVTAEVISKKKQGHCLPSADDGQSAVGIVVDLQRKIRSLRLQFMGAGPYGGSYAPPLLNLIRLANPLLKYANVCGPPGLRAVAHRLRTSGIAGIIVGINKSMLLWVPFKVFTIWRVPKKLGDVVKIQVNSIFKSSLIIVKKYNHFCQTSNSI